MTTDALHVVSVEYMAVTVLLPQLRALRDAGYRVRVACAPEGERFSDTLAEFDPVVVPFPRDIQPWQIARALRAYVSAVRAVEPSIVHLHSPAAALTARLVPRRLLPPDLRIVYTVHGFAHTWDEPTSRRDVVLERIERSLSPRTDMLLFQSREDFDETTARQYRTELRYLGNGVEDDWFDIAPPRREGVLRLLYVGRLVREKGILLLLDAVEQVEGVTLSIAGGQIASERDGVEDEVRRRAASDPLRGRVEMLGIVPREQLRGVVAAHDALVLPAVRREGLPRSIIEGLSAARPVITTDVRGCRELVTSGDNGFVTTPGDGLALRTAIEEMARLDSAGFDAMSRRARAVADAGYRESSVFERLKAAYRSLGVSGGGRPAGGA